MRSNRLSLILGLILGLFITFLLGTAYEHIRISGDLIVRQNNIYQSTLSGVSPEGECYLAVTNSLSGQTEVFAITKKVREQFKETSRPQGKHGSLTFFGPGPIDYERK